MAGNNAGWAAAPLYLLLSDCTTYPPVNCAHSSFSKPLTLYQVSGSLEDIPRRLQARARRQPGHIHGPIHLRENTHTLIHTLYHLTYAACFWTLKETRVHRRSQPSTRRTFKAGIKPSTLLLYKYFNLYFICIAFVLVISIYWSSIEHHGFLVWQNLFKKI